MNILNLWPTSIGLFEYTHSERINKELMSIQALRDFEWMGKHNIWDLKYIYPAINDLHDWILTCCSYYAKSLFEGEYLPEHFYHTHGWINYRNSGADVAVHNHRLTSITATYYVNVNDNSGDIRFIDPRSTLGWISMNSGKAYNRYDHKPKAGQLVLFPGWVIHQVLQNKSDEERVALSTNINLSDKFKYDLF